MQIGPERMTRQKGFAPYQNHLVGTPMLAEFKIHGVCLTMVIDTGCCSKFIRAVGFSTTFS